MTNIKWKTLRGFIKKEFVQILRDRKMIAAIFFVPVMQTIMFGLALTSEVKNIQLAVVSAPSPIAQEIATRATASGWFKQNPYMLMPAGTDAMALINSRKAEAVIIAPKEGFAYALERGKPAQVLINAVNAQRAQQVESYVRQITALAAKKYGYNLGGANSIQLESRVLYNHYMSSTDYMIPALMVMSTYIVLLVVCGMSIAKEKEAGTMEKLIASPATPKEILLGKTLPYFIIGAGIITFIFCIGVFGFGTPFRGYVWQLIITGALLACAALATATLLSTIAKTQQQAMMASVLVLMPSILLSGVFFPVSNIPLQFRWMCYFNPMMYCITNFRDIMLKGGVSAAFWQHSFLAFLLCFILGAAAYKNFKSTLN